MRLIDRPTAATLLGPAGGPLRRVHPGRVVHHYRAALGREPQRKPTVKGPGPVVASLGDWRALAAHLREAEA